MSLSLLRSAALMIGISIVATGCHRERPQFSVAQGPIVATAGSEPISMRVVDASERGRRIRVRAWLMNQGDHDVLIDRNALGLRLSDGRVLPVSSIRRHRPYVFAPGRGRILKVDFRVDGVADMNGASLTMAGASPAPSAVKTDPTCTTVPPGAIVVIGAPPGYVPPPFPPSPRAPSVAPSQPDEDDDESDDSAVGPSSVAPTSAAPTVVTKAQATAAKPEANVEVWQIGPSTPAHP